MNRIYLSGTVSVGPIGTEGTSQLIQPLRHISKVTQVAEAHHSLRSRAHPW